MGRFALVAGLLASAAGAQDWRPLVGEEIAAFLTDREVGYDRAWQRFFASGCTLRLSMLYSTRRIVLRLLWSGKSAEPTFQGSDCCAVHERQQSESCAAAINRSVDGSFGP